MKPHYSAYITVNYPDNTEAPDIPLIRKAELEDLLKRVRETIETEQALSFVITITKGYDQ